MRPSLVIIGLGNPGASYEQTRHNAGFQAVEALVGEYGEGEWKEKQKFRARILEGRVVTVPVLFAQPSLYMNRSGEAAKKLIDFYDLDPKTQLLVICDDVDLPLGELRLRVKGGPGTHNGLKSLVDVFGEEFPRLRIGLGAQSAEADLANWVLSVPSQEEEQMLKEAIQKIPEMVMEFVLGNNRQ